MKQGNALVNFVMIVMAIALACYMGIYVWNSFSDPFTTTYAYEYISSDGVEAQGFLARRERVLPQQAGIVDVTRGEGEKVGKGQTVALVHRDSRAVEIQADAIMMAKNIDGVYTADPAKDPTATLIKDITYQEALARGLKVMDAAAFALCADNKFPMVRVFGLNDPENLIRVLEGSDIGTFVHP